MWAMCIRNELNDIKVSVIIPAYNVEKYIKKCIDSVVKQTHKNLEILVVDDGSRDSTGILLDEIKLSDHRIHVIHKENGGVSSARNIGLDVATGDYVTFLDADDYFAEDFVQHMLEMVHKTGADFCISKCFITKEGEKQFPQQTVEKLTNAQGTALLLSPDTIVGCHNKLYQRELIEKNKLRFSTELFYGEGLFFITTVAQLAKCIAVTNRKVYFYRKDNQESATTRFSIGNLRNGWKALECIEKNLRIHSDDVETMLLLHRCNFSLGALMRIRVAEGKNQYLQDYKYWETYIHTNTKKLILKKNVSLYRKLLLVCGCICPRVLAALDVWRRNRIARHSVKG